MLEKLVEFQSSWLLTFYELFGCFSTFRFRKYDVKIQCKIQLCSETCKSSSGCLQKHIARAYPVQCLMVWGPETAEEH